jgi:hypothetical protein
VRAEPRAASEKGRNGRHGEHRHPAARAYSVALTEDDVPAARRSPSIKPASPSAGRAARRSPSAVAHHLCDRRAEDRARSGRT